MGGHKSVQQMTMNIGPMFVFLRMYLIAVCLDVRRSAASPRRPAPRAFRPGVLGCRRVQLHHHCTITLFLVWKILYDMRMRLWT